MEAGLYIFLESPVTSAKKRFGHLDLAFFTPTLWPIEAITFKIFSDQTAGQALGPDSAV